MMRKMRKVLSAVTTAAIVAVTAIPVIPVQAAVSPTVLFDFENGTGMSDSSISGATAPTVVNDADRGSNVLKFANGATSKIVQKAQDSSMGDYDMRIDKGTPSSLKFANPFKNKNLSGATISMWAKVPSEDAGANGAGLVGFISGDKTVIHPDKASGDPNKQGLDDAHGPYMLGVTTAYFDDLKDLTLPMVYFAGLHHNSFNFGDTNGTFQSANVWKYITVCMNNSDITVYIDGKAIDGDIKKNKRWNDGEINGGSAGNVGQTKLMTMLAWPDVEAYVGYTGFSPTFDGVCIDDLSFFSKELSAAEVSALYEAAKTGEVKSTGGGGDTSDAKKKQDEAKAQAEAEAAAAEAAAVEANKNLTNAVVNSVVVYGMPASAAKNVSGIFRGDEAYTELLAKINSVTLRDGFRMANVVGLDINYNGTQPEALATVTMKIPDGFNPDTMELARVNDDGTVSVLKYTIENNMIVAKTNHFSTFAIVELEEGVYNGKSSSNLPKTGVVSGGIVIALGALSTLGGAAILKKRKEEE